MKLPILAVSTFWFLYFIGLGIFIPYYPRYLDENARLSGTQIGLVLAMFPLLGVFTQPWWGWLADRSGRRRQALLVLTFAVGSLHLVLGTARGFKELLLDTAFLAVFSTSVVPASTAFSLAVLAGDSGKLGRMRVWGTCGFLLGVVVFPWGLRQWSDSRGIAALPDGPSEPGLGIMFAVISTCAFLACATLAFMPRADVPTVRASRGQWRALVRNPPFLRVLGLSLLAYAFLHGPLGFLPLYVESQGGNIATLRVMWLLMLAFELPFVFALGSFRRWLGPRGLVMLGILAGGGRWLVCGLTDSLEVAVAVQALHGCVVMGLILGTAIYADELIPVPLRSSGQALLAMAGPGLGAIVSNAGSGWLLDHMGPRALYTVGGGGAIVIGLLAASVLPAPHSQNTSNLPSRLPTEPSTRSETP